MNKKDRVTYYKRKRGILKKCIELSTKCDQDIYLVILDKKNQRLVEFNSSDRFNIEAVINTKKYEQVFDFCKYCNEDLHLLEDNMTPHQFEGIETKYKRTLNELRAANMPPVVQPNDMDYLENLARKLRKVDNGSTFP